MRTPVKTKTRETVSGLAVLISRAQKRPPASFRASLIFLPSEGQMNNSFCSHLDHVNCWLNIFWIIGQVTTISLHCTLQVVHFSIHVTPLINNLRCALHHGSLETGLYKVINNLKDLTLLKTKAKLRSQSEATVNIQDL